MRLRNSPALGLIRSTYGKLKRDTQWNNVKWNSECWKFRDVDEDANRDEEIRLKVPIPAAECEKANPRMRPTSFPFHLYVAKQNAKESCLPVRMTIDSITQKKQLLVLRISNDELDNET